MDRRPTTEERGGLNWDQQLDVPEVKSGVTLPPKISELRKKLGQKAKQEPKFRFYALYDRIDREDVLRIAATLVLNHNGAPGVDGVTCQDLLTLDEPAWNAFFRELHEELRTKRYRPQPVKRVYIPKPDGRMRPLGIPTVKDRIVQTAGLLILEPIFEADFLGCSYGFRPGRNAHQAIDAVHQHISAGFREIYDADLKSYFDTIPHDALIKCLERRIADRSVLKLIRMWLECPIVETDERGRTTVTRSTQGTPQGGAKAMTRAHDRVRELTGPKRCFVPIREMIDDINRWSKGWSGYFRPGYPRKCFRELNRFMLLRSTRHLQRRSQRAYRTPEGVSFYAHLQRLGPRLL